MTKQIEFLVGDNPFHGISHLSQKRARARSTDISLANGTCASQVVNTSLQNGAEGFMFSVSETTLSILKAINKQEKPALYAIIPYAYEYARLATSAGGFSGLAAKITRQIVFSTNVFSVAKDSIRLIRADPLALLRTYLNFEISRIELASEKKCNLKSIMLHEILTDMALSFNLNWLFEFYIDFLLKKNVRPGFETRNFAYLIDKFNEWNIDLSKVSIAAPFNNVGFQMNPSKAACEKALEDTKGAEVIAMSILAAGYLKPAEAMNYILNIPNISKIVVGVSKEAQAKETFKLMKEFLTQNETSGIVM